MMVEDFKVTGRRRAGKVFLFLFWWEVSSTEYSTLWGVEESWSFPGEWQGNLHENNAWSRKGPTLELSLAPTGLTRKALQILFLPVSPLDAGVELEAAQAQEGPEGGGRGNVCFKGQEDGSEDFSLHPHMGHLCTCAPERPPHSQGNLISLGLKEENNDPNYPFTAIRKDEVLQC